MVLLITGVWVAVATVLSVTVGKLWVITRCEQALYYLIYILYVPFCVSVFSPSVLYLTLWVGVIIPGVIWCANISFEGWEIYCVFVAVIYGIHYLIKRDTYD